MEKVKDIVEKRGKAAIEKAHEELLGLHYKGGSVSSALEYFAETTLHRSLPVFPALISLSCEAVGGRTEKTTSIGAALTLIAVAADIHDDIIDKSKTKYGKKTVVGKFGRDVALLTGDALLFHGLVLLNRECESLSKKQKEAIVDSTSKAFFEISNAEAEETFLRKKRNVTPQEYFDTIKMKATVPEMHCKIGAILGDGNIDYIKFLGSYGRAFGITSITRDEFIDLLEYTELLSRIENEVPPLPVLHALQNPEVRMLLERKNLTKRAANKLVKLVLNSKQVQQLRRYVESTINHGLDCIAFVQNKQIKKDLEALLFATTTEL